MTIGRWIEPTTYNLCDRRPVHLMRMITGIPDVSFPVIKGFYINNDL